MIAKEKTTPIPPDRFGKAGHDAEVQMAFYLRRAFADADDILVFNDLRLERNGDFAQIDHLVLHRFGFAIVESKSVVDEIVVNAQGEFSRKYNCRFNGMQSPIRQAEIQADLLSKLLNDHKESLRRKVHFGLQQAYFGEERFRVFVAISDRGKINRVKCNPEELCKADTITEKIREIIDGYASMSGFRGFVKLLVADKKTSKEMEKNILPPLTGEELEKVKTFLLERHTPLVERHVAEVVEAMVVKNVNTGFMPTPPPIVVAPPPPPPILSAVAPPATNSAKCRNCAQGNLAIQYKHNYFYKCLDCQGNTPADYSCTACGEKARISKSGNKFSRNCDKCGTNVVFHVNPV